MNDLEVLELAQMFGAESLLLKPEMDLIVRHVDKNGVVWATRGANLFRSTAATSYRFEFHTTLPTTSLVDLLCCKYVRQYTCMHDVIQPFWLRDGTLIVFSGGYIWKNTRRDPTEFHIVHKLEYWGPRKGRGVLHHGLVELPSGRVVFGEYHRNEKRLPVAIYVSDDAGDNWRVLQTFPEGSVRHIHAMQIDPYDDSLWMCTGDQNNESFLARSTDEGNSFEIIGSGSQLWRTCCLLFQKDSIYWGVDTSSDTRSRYICRFDRTSRKLHKEVAIDGAVEFGCCFRDGSMFFATTRTGLENDSDPSPSVWFNRSGTKWCRAKLGNWNPKSVKRSGTPYMYGSSDLQQLLALSLVNIYPYQNQVLVFGWKTLTK